MPAYHSASSLRESGVRYRWKSPACTKLRVQSLFWGVEAISRIQETNKKFLADFCLQVTL